MGHKKFVVDIFVRKEPRSTTPCGKTIYATKKNFSNYRFSAAYKVN
jgi:hypothetical protein